MLHFVIVAVAMSFFLIMAGLWFLSYSKKEGHGKFHHIISYAAIVFGLLIITGAVVGGIVKMACKGHCGEGKGCHKEMHHGKGHGTCEMGEGHGEGSCPMMKGAHGSCSSKGECGSSMGMKHHGMIMDGCSGSTMTKSMEEADTIINGKHVKEVKVVVESGNK
ncbi:MAG: hypothetical protein K1X56_03675 [Flavobacteriales bacterium]|nr:hypothetical protein [Flavobacteriales bacterium]